ncbi:hypothetical protein COEREDRAFT_79681 [Coemansia reversa NRRL 1564]|uniref:Uncharacterized protein n=1 Tax=Coemansia reversa (strain ATCC 12441 / NRRL 1564) TaxID=763665 RepID=A0A2G5BI47_COERN|nr:hypothetical protein COEREDRAFT_79681 [Coemansia reversa NRRL 1564]|eukprot:PIA18675.1 hypothetical protein COEREDRAFT_79681 [Coemansia reversa NRRL 1564]
MAAIHTPTTTAKHETAVANEYTPLLYNAYCPPPKPLSPEDIVQRRRSLGIDSVLSIDASSAGLTPLTSDYLSVSASDAHSRLSAQSCRSSIAAAGIADQESRKTQISRLRSCCLCGLNQE